MSLPPEVQMLANSGIVGVLAYFLIVRIEKKLDSLIESVNKLVSAINVAGTHA